MGTYRIIAPEQGGNLHERGGLDDGPELPRSAVMAWKEPLIIKAWREGLSARACARVFDVSHDTAARIVRGQTKCKSCDDSGYSFDHTHGVGDCPNCNNEFQPYPEKIGIVKFKDGSYEVDDRTPTTPPNELYIRADYPSFGEDFQNDLCSILSKYGVTDIYNADAEILSLISDRLKK